MANHLIIRGKSECSQNLHHPHPSSIFGGSHFCCHGEILVEIALVFPGGFWSTRPLHASERFMVKACCSSMGSSSGQLRSMPTSNSPKDGQFHQGLWGLWKIEWDRTHRIHLEIPDSTDSSRIFRWRFQLFGTESEGSGCWWRATAVQISSVGKYERVNNQREFQDPKMEVLYHIRPYFVGIFPSIGLI